MSSPFPPSTSTPGEGLVVAKRLANGDSTLEKIVYQYPLKLITPPRPADRRSVLIFLLSYGGGLVAGDSVDLALEVRPGARMSVVTQGHTKIFKAPPARADKTTRQVLRAGVADGAALCLLPDPVQPFAGSVYEQRQVFRLAPRASLCVLDWVTQGRAARGEDWDLGRWVGRNEVWVDSEDADGCGRLLVRDAVVLDQDGAGLYAGSLRQTMHGQGIFGMLILRGPLAKSLGEFFVAEFAALPRLGARDFRTPEAVAADEKSMGNMPPLEKWRAQRQKLEKEHKVLWSAASVRGCVVVKFGATEVEGGRLWVGSMLTQEGSVAETFGAHALMCVR